MKRLLFVVTLGFLAMAILSVGCVKTTPAPATPTQNVTGVLTDLNTPAEPGKDVVTVQTPQGPQTFPITANTNFALEGQVCTLDDVGKVLATANATYQCNLYYDEQLNVVNLTVWQSVDPLKNR